ncbi:hypothetical protein K457DRAFT_133144 [Linnemannia elongata AG-77]|uniref:F-box domain-containing protein n=1 Tax=Linnemannia elongata AG-77 TaxID=1314771 RepID=A0A197KB16_9FUNG|nr:hypothetical protein K457DRAFT_133144 [Linnemannia elongata AG-77]
MARAITEKYPAPLAVGNPQPQQHQQPYPFQETLPTEIWRLVLTHVPTLDLFSLYNTSRYLRSLSAPFLVQAMASKSLRLYFYQEYVRRVGVKFVFESFDLERDRVVFRPLVRDNQYRFRTGITLQSPQLEEVAVKSTGGEIDMRRVQCDRDRYFSIKPVERAAPAPAAPAQDISQHSQTDAVEFEVDGDMEADVDLGTDGLEAPETTAVATETEATTANTTTPAITTAPVPLQVIQTTSATRKRTADEKSYQGTKNFLDRSCPVPVRKTGVCKMDGTRYSFLQTYPWTLEYQVESEIMGPLVALEGEHRSESDSTSKISNGKGKIVDYESRGHIGNTGSSNSRAEGRDQLTTDNQHQHQLYHRPQDAIEYAPLPYERMDSNGSNSSSGSGTGSVNISSCDNAHSTTPSHRRANSPDMADKFADKSAHSLSARTTHRPGSAGNSSNSNSGNGPRFLRTLRFECSMNFLDPKRATRSVLGRWLEGKVYQWSKVLGGKKGLSNGQSHAIQWQSTLKQQSQSQSQLRQQQKQLGKQKGKQKDNKQKQPLSTSALYRTLQQQDQQIRRSDSTESVGSGTTTAPPAPAAAAPPRRRGRVIRAIDILLGPTDSDGSSINHEKVRQRSMNGPFHSQSSSHSGSSTSLSLSLPHQGDASIAGGRCMVPAIDLNKMGSSSTSATF